MKRLLFLSLIGLSLAIGASAQSTFGAIVGTVKDSSGAMVSAAKVTVLNTDENTSKTFLTDSNGSYEALNLLQGTYTVTIAQPGFQEEVVTGVTLAARQTSRVDITLKLGTASQSVNVEGTVGVVESETDAISSSIDTEKILALPSNLRASTSTSPYQLLTTLPGVQPDSGNANGVYLSIQGGIPNQSESSIDGISSQNVRSNRPLVEIFPSVEAIQEIKVSGVGNNAEYGSAGDITTITKSGTNEIHGSAVWYYQNADFDAVPFGASSKPEKEVNNFGFTAGGPVFIPKVYDGRNKSFFFADYEDLMYPRQSVIQDTVPSAVMKSGNFAGLATIIDPTTGVAFAGNAIPSSRISPIAQKILGTFYPDPNQPGTSTNYIVNKASDIQSKQFDIRGDQYFTTKQQIFARFSFKNGTSLGANDILLPTTDNAQQDRSFVLSYNYTITPRLINEFRFGWTSDSPGSNFAYDGKAFEKSLGFIGLPSTPFNGLPEIDFSNFTGMTVDRVQDIELYRTFEVNNNTTYTLGRHTLKFGVDVRWLRSKTGLGFIGADNFGNFNFTGAFTGNDMADFLLGLPHDTSYGNVQHDNDGSNRRYQAYVQDSFHFGPKLTLEYGIRWDWNPPFVDKYGYIGNFNPSVPLTGQAIYPTGFGNQLAPELLFATNACPGTPNLGTPGPGIAGVPCTPYLTNSQAHIGSGLRTDYWHNFYPRVGFAYRPFSDGNTVIRAGFGLFDAPLLGAVFYSLTGTTQTDVRTFNNVSPTGQPIFAWPDTHSGGTGVSSDSYGTAYFGTANSTVLKNPYMMQWNVSVDRNIGFNTGLRVSYIGSHSLQLGWAQNYNQSPNSTTFYDEQPLTDRPFPYWGRIENRDSGATAKYNSLQIEANRRFSHGLTYNAAYTLAVNKTDQGSFPTAFGGETGNGRIADAYNRYLDWGNQYGTRRNRFISTAVYELPFGKGRSFMGQANTFADAILGGWHLSTILLVQSGPYETPYIPSGVIDPSGSGSGGYRSQWADLVGSPTPSGQNRNDWISSGAFACPGSTVGGSATTCTIGSNPSNSAAPIGRFGNSGVGFIEGPGTLSLSTGLGKTFNFGEHFRAKIEGSFTNVLNHTNLADANTNLTSSGFGTITSAVGTDFGGARTGQVGVRLEF